MESIFDVCSFAIGTVKHLYIANRQLNGNPIEFPIDYLTVTGTTDSIIKVEGWDSSANYALMGGQYIEWKEVPNMGDNIELTEEYIEGKQGQTFNKTIVFRLPYVNFNTNAKLKEFLFTDDGEFAISKAMAFVIDNNNQRWIIGYDVPLILQDGMELSVSAENYYTFTFKSISFSRIRNYQIIES